MPQVVVCHPDQEQYGQAVADEIGADLRTSRYAPRGHVYVMDPDSVLINGQPLDIETLDDDPVWPDFV